MTEQMSQGTPQSSTPLAVPWTPPAQTQPPMQAQAQPMPPQYHAAPQAYPPQQMAAHQPYQQQHAPQMAPAPMPHNGQPIPPAGYTPPSQEHRPQHDVPVRNFPPMPMEAPSQPEPEAAPKSKSLFANLLKRQPKPAASAAPVKEKSGSLFDKNFVIGLVAGTVLGFVGLPMVLGGSSEPAESYTPTAELAVPQMVEPVAIETEGEAFVDVALAEETP